MESSRILGGVGAILLAIPFLNIVGNILVLVAMKGFARYYNDDDIFKNTLYGFVFSIIGVVFLIFIIIILVSGFDFVTSIDRFLSGIQLLIISLIVMYVFSLFGAIFYKRALKTLSAKTGEKVFLTAGLVLLIVSIIPLFGEMLKFIAWILAAVGFFSIRTPT